MSTQPFTGETNNQSSSVTPNTTKVYEVQNMSNWSIFIFVLAAPLSLFLAFGIALGFDGSAITFFVGVAAAVGLMIYLYRYLQQKILVTVGEGSIHIHYLRCPFFASKPEMDLVPEDIASYKFDNFNGARFVLHMKDGRKFRAAVGNVGKRTAIEQMAEHVIAVINGAALPAATAPRRRATYAEGTTGLVWAIVAIAAIITMGIAIIFFPENHKTSDTVRAIGVMLMCLAFVTHVFNLRRKARNKQDEQMDGNSGG